MSFRSWSILFNCVCKDTTFLLEQIGMGASLQEKQRQLPVVLFPSHQPVRLNVTFPCFAFLVHEFVGTVFLWQFPRVCKYVNGVFDQFDVQATFQAAFQVFVEPVGIVNLVHSLKSA